MGSDVVFTIDLKEVTMLSTELLRENIQTKQLTKKELAERLYGSLTFDYAIPQDWVNSVARELDIPSNQVANQFVWIYPDGSVFGQAGPLTEEAVDLLEQLS